ncbi:MAG: DEAD/DEAH box helicase [Armatimonadetes bacterium]|nr:DEAD/DEAH box helicase [Armatimonadota bacterium]MDE2206980.1 DEAD/DEAH box helicase [Armatimonadota bacterium]
MSFDQLGLRAELLNAVASSGYTVPTPVQEQAIPAVLQRRDVIAGAQTGTGKTAAFALPILQRLMECRPARSGGYRPVRTLVLAPTRELAAQVRDSFALFSRGLPLTSTAVFGGVSMYAQVQALRRGVDVVVATPGRLLDHASQGTIDLSHVEVLVLDEADRMLDMGFVKDIRRIIALLPTQRQNLLFTATFTDEMHRLAGSILNDPARIEVDRTGNTSDLVDHTVYAAHRNDKRDLLVHLLVEKQIGQALVFIRTRHGADRLVKQLQQDGVAAAPIHSNRSQLQRMRALADFKAGRTRILVATDIASRGLDIDQLPFVINYELPACPDDYVHRIGRTGRAGTRGNAISLVSHEERSQLAGIEMRMRRQIERGHPVGFSPSTVEETPIREQPRFRAPRSAFQPRTAFRGGHRSATGPHTAFRRSAVRDTHS